MTLSVRSRRFLSTTFFKYYILLLIEARIYSWLVEAKYYNRTLNRENILFYEKEAKVILGKFLEQTIFEKQIKNSINLFHLNHKKESLFLNLGD
jgi:hypothetical protein